MSSRSTDHVTSEALKRDLERVAELLDKAPTVTEYEEHGVYSSTTISKRFNTWNIALEEVGLEPNREYNIPEVRLLSELRRVANKLDETPAKSDYNEHGRYSVSAYRYRFGSWGEAVEEAGLTPIGVGGSKLSRKLDELDPDAVGGESD